jgi:hypothetical protein
MSPLLEIDKTLTNKGKDLAVTIPVVNSINQNIARSQAKTNVSELPREFAES